ncbi:hypothetical protein [Pectobacterium brasiliense]|uniref:hypothetical protein n=1 Tax=Pectobacterium brasiliense TaxID=180957 RepID=UPI003987D43F
MNEQVISLITHLNRYTIDGSLLWQRANPPFNLINGTDSKISLFFKTFFSDTYFGLYEERYKDYSQDFDQLYWASRVVLCTLDNFSGDVIWQYSENISILHNLYENIRYKSSGIEGILNNYSPSPKR